MTSASATRTADFYPRPPRGGRPSPPSLVSRSRMISIHALREEGDIPESYTELDGSVFLSTPSARRATHGLQAGDVKVEISIHALREEGDLDYDPIIDIETVFLSTPSARRATRYGMAADWRMVFLSTPSARRATYELKLLGIDTVISIHALREEGDAATCTMRFYISISIHALREEGDSRSWAH